MLVLFFFPALRETFAVFFVPDRAGRNFFIFPDSIYAMGVSFGHYKLEVGCRMSNVESAAAGSDEFFLLRYPQSALESSQYCC